MTNDQLRELIIRELSTTLVEDWMNEQARSECFTLFAESVSSQITDEVLANLRAVLVKHGAAEEELPAALAKVIARETAPHRQRREQQWKEMQLFERSIFGPGHGNN